MITSPGYAYVRMESPRNAPRNAPKTAHFVRYPEDAAARSVAKCPKTSLLVRDYPLAAQTRLTIDAGAERNP